MPHPLMGIKDGDNLYLNIMTQDKDLQFLQFCKNDDLITLCNILTKDNFGNYRFNEQLTSTNSYPQNMNNMWVDLANELQRYGGNTLVNVFMRNGRGPAYAEIVKNVCHKLKVSVPQYAYIAHMGAIIMENIIDNTLSKMPKKEIRNLCNQLNISCGDKLAKDAILAALIASRMESLKVYKLLILNILSFISHTLIFPGSLTGDSFIMTHPLGLVLRSIMTTAQAGMSIWDVVGPAYRVIIPAILQVALIRMDYLSSVCKAAV